MRIQEAPPSWQWERVTPAYIVGPIVTLRHISLGFSREEMVRQYRWGQDEELQYWSGSVPAAQSLVEFEASMIASIRQRDARRDRYAILDPLGGLMGVVSYFNVDFDRRLAELGIYIGERDRWDQGIGTEAVLTFLAHLFRNTDLRTMRLKTLASNARAQNCYRKCGFEVTSSLRKYSARLGYHVEVQMETTRESFQASFGRRPISFYSR